MEKIPRVRLFVNHNIKSRKVEKIVREALEKEKLEIVSDDHFDIGMAIGGDGSFLRMVRESHFLESALYVGINAGTLGFAQEISLDEIFSFIKHLKKGEFSFEEVGIESVLVHTQDKRNEFCCLNEIVVRDEELNTMHCDVFIDGVLLENYVGDGLLVSTSFGSTAYNLSFGGSIVYNEFSTLQITPVAPMNNKSYHSLGNSLVIPSNKVITLVPNVRRNNLLITVDGENVFYNHVLKIEVQIQKNIKVIRKKDYNYIRKINDKFIQ